jgi:DNA-directed RNA polymerase specialized sigma24 family protein
VSPPPLVYSCRRARTDAAGALCNWRVNRLQAIARTGFGRFGRYRLPADLAEEVLDAAFTSIAEELTLDRLPSLAPADVKTRATVRAESRAIDVLRQLGRRPRPISLDATDSAGAADQQLHQIPVALLVDSPAALVAERDVVKSVMRALPPADRRLLSLHALGWSPTEIGARLGVAAAAVRKRGERAAKRARACRAAQGEV